MINKNYKIQVLAELFRASVADIKKYNPELYNPNYTFVDYIQDSANSDPNFFAWLFDDGTIDILRDGEHEKEEEEYKDFLRFCEDVNPYEW